jgi:hypothetical protein
VDARGMLQRQPRRQAARNTEGDTHLETPGCEGLPRARSEHSRPGGKDPVQRTATKWRLGPTVYWPGTEQGDRIRRVEHEVRRGSRE